MDIRKATEEDIPDIVGLLKLSLGEHLMPKSERYWRWKHIDNPFGKSPVLICRDGNTLVGVRAFMRWEWIQKGKIYRAVRAVDTATHPDYQGKGIFKKLTLSLVDYCKDQGDHFVFNTPNLQSKPGYLKMGWTEAGRLPVKIKIQRPLNILKNWILKREITPARSTSDSLKYYLHHNGVDALLGDYQRQVTSIVTNSSASYLNWRYESVPVESYTALGDEDEKGLVGLIIGRRKNTRFGTEFRITDCFSRTGGDVSGLTKKLRSAKKEWGIDYITISGTKGLGNALNFGLLAKVGPVVTLRALTVTDLTLLMQFHNWSPSLGDLELF